MFVCEVPFSFTHDTHSRSYVRTYMSTHSYLLLLYVRNECYEYKRSSTRKNYRWTNVMNSNMTQSPKTRQIEDKNASKYVCMNVLYKYTHTHKYASGIEYKKVWDAGLPAAHVVSHFPFVTFLLFCERVCPRLCVCAWESEFKLYVNGIQNIHLYVNKWFMFDYVAQCITHINVCISFKCL